jgi:hypothetical protein
MTPTRLQCADKAIVSPSSAGALGPRPQGGPTVLWPGVRFERSGALLCSANPTGACQCRATTSVAVEMVALRCLTRCARSLGRGPCAQIDRRERVARSGRAAIGAHVPVMSPSAHCSLIAVGLPVQVAWVSTFSSWRSSARSPRSLAARCFPGCRPPRMLRVRPECRRGSGDGQHDQQRDRDQQCKRRPGNPMT